jgi:hypothetical protein
MQPMMTRIARGMFLLACVVLSGCAASNLPGFQNAYYSYNVPESLVNQIKTKFQEHGLNRASVTRDNVGRIELTGTYKNEDDVDKAFSIVQSIVGLKSTSPFYPQDVQQKRWELAAAKALDSDNKRRKEAASAPKKIALVIGINHFMDSERLHDIQGADDAAVVQRYLQAAGFSVTAILGDQATKRHVEQALHQLDDSIGPNDNVFIYISSHGNAPVPSPTGTDQRKMSIMVFDSGEPGVRVIDKVDFKIRLQETSVADTLVQAIAKKPSRITRMLIDTCYSGDMLDDVSAESHAYILKTNNGRAEHAGISLASWTGPAYTTKGIRFADDSGKSTSQANKPTAKTVIDRSRSGYTIITATSENEESLGPDAKVGTFTSPIPPYKPLRGSFFTQSLFDYLGKYNGNLDASFRDAQSFTSTKVIEVTNGQSHQVPRQYSTIPAQQNQLLQ